MNDESRDWDSADKAERGREQDETTRLGQTTSVIRWSDAILLNTPNDWMPHQRRVVLEHNELFARLAVLEEFLHQPPRSVMIPGELHLLTAQAGMMRALRDVMRSRMQLWGLPIASARMQEGHQ